MKRVLTIALIFSLAIAVREHQRYLAIRAEWARVTEMNKQTGPWSVAVCPNALDPSGTLDSSCALHALMTDQHYIVGNSLKLPSGNFRLYGDGVDGTRILVMSQ
jgi:hypothetical protein